MPYLRLALIIFTLLSAMTVHGRQQRDSVLERVISVQADNQTIQSILEQITRESNIFFSFDASIIPPGHISVRFHQRKVGDILREIFPPDQFRLLGKIDHIIISSLEEIDSDPNPHDSIPLPPKIIISGKLIDRSTREPLSYASISLLRLPIGTITNRDGEYILKLPTECINDTLVFSTLGYSRILREVNTLQEGEAIALQSVSIRIKEIKVRAVSVEEILDGVRSNIRKNYSMDFQLLTGFYRETIRQDDAYISVSEAAMEILKASYEIPGREDRVRLLKARKSPDVKPFHWVNFKLQGGPYTITMLDVVKNMETFLDPDYQNLYKFTIQQVIWYKGHATFVIHFKPIRNLDFPTFEGDMYIDRESHALMYAKFSLDNYGLEMAEQSLIRKKPKGFKVRPLSVDYQVDFSELNGRWHLHTAQASVSFRVRSTKEKVNSVFHTVSDLLITDVRETELKRFPVRDLFTVNDIFTEMTIDYDEKFWGNYNIIKPDEDLKNAVKGFLPEENP